MAITISKSVGVVACASRSNQGTHTVASNDSSLHDIVPHNQIKDE